MTKGLWLRDLFLAALVLCLVAAGAPSRVSALTDASIGFSPGTQTIHLGDSTTVDIAISADDIFGFQFTVSYDTTRLTATDATLLDTWFDGTFSPWAGVIDDVEGSVKFASSLQKGDTPPSGSGAVARITFSGDAVGLASLAFGGVKLVRFVGGEQGTEVIAPVGEVPGSINIIGQGTISGTVRLQGRSDHSGATVAAGSVSTTTDALGAYSLTVWEGSYTVTVEMPRYLDAERTGVAVTTGGAVTLPQVILLGGDANDDDTIDVSDSSIIGGQFGKTSGFDVRADINNDGQVDILDLVLMGGNYFSTSPVPW